MRSSLTQDPVVWASVKRIISAGAPVPHETLRDFSQRLSPEAEPDIYATMQRWGTVLENVVMDQETRKLDLDDGSDALDEEFSRRGAA